MGEFEDATATKRGFLTEGGIRCALDHQIYIKNHVENLPALELGKIFKIYLGYVRCFGGYVLI